MIAPITALGGGISPFIAGWMFDRTGSYDTILFIMGAGAFVSAGLMLLARPPRVRIEELEPTAKARMIDDSA